MDGHGNYGRSKTDEGPPVQFYIGWTGTNACNASSTFEIRSGYGLLALMIHKDKTKTIKSEGVH